VPPEQSPLDGARARRLILLAIVAVAVGLRLVGLGDRLSDAEGYSWLVASSSSVGQFFDRLADYENTPPLFYALLAPLPLDSEAWLRVPALVPSVACVPVLYALVRPLLGTRIALLAAAALAVAPFHVSYANYSRAFMLAALGVLVAAWAVARLAQGRRSRWWWLYLAGATVALHAEYDSLLVLAPLLALPALWREQGWRRTTGIGVLPLLTLVPLIGQMLRGLDQLDVTKLAPPTPGLGVGPIRDSAVSLFTGTSGLMATGAARWLQFLALAGVLAVAARLLAGSPRLDLDDRDRAIALWLFAVLPAVAFALHVLASAAGPDIFDARYQTALIPLVVAMLAAAVDATPWRWAMPLAALAIAGLGVAVVIQRSGPSDQPDPRPAGRMARDARAGTVLTNSPVIAFYLRDQDVRLDRPFGLGKSKPSCPPFCRRPLAVIEDSRLPDGVRRGDEPVVPTAEGRIGVRIVP